MALPYDKYYQNEGLFGEPYPALIEFFAEYSPKGKVVDLGCGQGRDAIALARLGYAVTGIDHSKVGIEQMNQVAQSENLNLIGLIRDVYAFDRFDEFDFILLDSMFHFTKKDKEKEVGLIHKIVSKAKAGCLIVICIQDTGNKARILDQVIESNGRLGRIADQKFKYTFEDDESGHRSETDYRMVIVEK